MIVTTNKYLPVIRKKIARSNSYLKIAETDGGDEAFYTKNLPAGYDDDEEYDDDDEMSDYDDMKSSKSFTSLTRPHQSMSGENWRPVFHDRLTMFIAGAPGAGKSYLAKQMINLLPSNIPILLFTALEEGDGNFKDLGKDRLYTIKMTPENLSTITLKEIRDRVKTPQTILLFDDVDKIRNSKVQAAIFSIMNDALANGRGHEKHDGEGDLHVVCTSHSANDYQKTKYTFENSNYVALFPGSTPPLQMYRMFDKLGLSKELCQKMIRLGKLQKIRSIIIHKVVPMYMIYGDKIMLL